MEAPRPRASGRAKQGRTQPSEASHRPKGEDGDPNEERQRPSEARPHTTERSEPPTQGGQAWDSRGVTKLPPQYLAGVASAVHHGSAVLRASRRGINHQPHGRPSPSSRPTLAILTADPRHPHGRPSPSSRPTHCRPSRPTSLSTLTADPHARPHWRPHGRPSRPTSLATSRPTLTSRTLQGGGQRAKI